MARLLVAGFVSTVFGAFEFSEAIANHEPEMYVVFFALNGTLALGLVALGWLTGRIVPHLGRYRPWILPVAWFAWVAAYRVIPTASIALAALIVFAIAAPDRDSATIPEPPVC